MPEQELHQRQIAAGRKGKGNYRTARAIEQVFPVLPAAIRTSILALRPYTQTEFRILSNSFPFRQWYYLTVNIK